MFKLVAYDDMPISSYLVSNPVSEFEDDDSVEEGVSQIRKAYDLSTPDFKFEANCHPKVDVEEVVEAFFRESGSSYRPIRLKFNSLDDFIAAYNLAVREFMASLVHVKSSSEPLLLSQITEDQALYLPDALGTQFKEIRKRFISLNIAIQVWPVLVIDMREADSEAWRIFCSLYYHENRQHMLNSLVIYNSLEDVCSKLETFPSQLEYCVSLFAKIVSDNVRELV